MGRPVTTRRVVRGGSWNNNRDIGFVVYQTHRLLKARKVHTARRHLGERMDAYQAGRISFAELDASIKGWVNHVRYADSWGLRRHVFHSLRGRRRPPTTR